MCFGLFYFYFVEVSLFLSCGELHVVPRVYPDRFVVVVGWSWPSRASLPIIIFTEIHRIDYQLKTLRIVFNINYAKISKRFQPSCIYHPTFASLLKKSTPLN